MAVQVDTQHNHNTTVGELTRDGQLFMEQNQFLNIMLLEEQGHAKTLVEHSKVCMMFNALLVVWVSSWILVWVEPLAYLRASTKATVGVRQRNTFCVQFDEDANMKSNIHYRACMGESDGETPGAHSPAQAIAQAEFWAQRLGLTWSSIESCVSCSHGSELLQQAHIYQKANIDQR